jgi:hypothetical protein
VKCETKKTFAMVLKRNFYPGEWSCGKCRFQNFSAAEVCKECGEKKGAKFEQVPKEETEEMKVEEEEEEEEEENESNEEENEKKPEEPKDEPKVQKKKIKVQKKKQIEEEPKVQNSKTQKVKKNVEKKLGMKTNLKRERESEIPNPSKKKKMK